MKMADERLIELHEISETFADLLFSVEVTQGNVLITLGVTRVDHRSDVPMRSEVPVARIVLTHKLSHELAVALDAAKRATEKPISSDSRAAITLARPKKH